MTAMKCTQLHQLVHNVNNVAPVCAIQTHGEVEVKFHSFLISVLDVCKWSASFSYLNTGFRLHIQGVTGGTDQTSGECSLGQTIPI